ncbi:MAG: hypothetical protein RLZZ15_3203 [Verrucomicrobiota bacterium]|jgi:hypothetical protein
MAFILFAPLVSAQPAPSPLRFTVFAAKPLENITFLPRAGAKPQPVVFYPTARSPRYEFRGPWPLRFVDSTSGAVVAELAAPADTRDALLLFTPLQPAPATGPRFQITVVNATAAHHAAGQIAILNLGGATLTGTINGEPLTLPAGLSPPIAVGRSAKLVLRAGSAKRTAYAGTVELGPKDRALLLLLPPYYKGSSELQARALIDQPSAAK